MLFESTRQRVGHNNQGYMVEVKLQISHESVSITRDAGARGNVHRAEVESTEKEVAPQHTLYTVHSYDLCGSCSVAGATRRMKNADSLTSSIMDVQSATELNDHYRRDEVLL